MNVEKQLVDGERGTGWVFLIEYGDPVYAVFTNEQLAAMVKKPPSSIKDIGSIAGVGEARVTQYGEVFLTLLHELFGPGLNR